MTKSPNVAFTPQRAGALLDHIKWAYDQLQEVQHSVDHAATIFEAIDLDRMDTRTIQATAKFCRIGLKEASKVNCEDAGTRLRDALKDLELYIEELAQ